MARSTPPPSDDFDRLRKMLSLMAYEAPPPGYFDTFSSKVMARIQAGAHDPNPGWWERTLLVLWTRPWAGAAAALAIAALMVMGLDQASALQPGLTDVDRYYSGAPAAVQAAMFDWSLREKDGSAALMPAGQFSGVAPFRVEPRSLGADWASPGSPSVFPASFTPAF
jgi:hypothetical protein